MNDRELLKAIHEQPLQLQQKIQNNIDYLEQRYINWWLRPCFLKEKEYCGKIQERTQRIIFIDSPRQRSRLGSIKYWLQESELLVLKCKSMINYNCGEVRENRVHKRIHKINNFVTSGNNLTDSMKAELNELCNYASIDKWSYSRKLSIFRFWDT